MKSLLNTLELEEILIRLEQLTPNSPAQWGKMNVTQMFTHCRIILEMATGDVPQPFSLLGRLLGWLFKPGVLNDQPRQRNSPTLPSFQVADTKNFEQEKQDLIRLLKKFQNGGAASVTKLPHAFYGFMTPEEWGIQQFGHLNHHLTQFGV
jgi:hypothetical protein